MKINSLSKAVLTAMLVSGTLATATPIHASSDTPSAVQTVKTQQTNDADVQATIVTNDDGTKTVKVTIPADQVVNASAKNGTFTATTNDDTTAEVDSGSVKQTKNKIKFNVELNKDALSNEKLLTEDLTITISDSKGNEIGKISELTLQDLLASSEDGVSESSSSTAESSSQSTKEESSTSNSKAESSSAKNESSDAKTSSSAESSSDKASSASSNTSESGSKAESSSTTALAPDAPANDTATSTADAGSTANANSSSASSAANSASSSAPSSSSSAPSSSSSSDSAANASSTGTADSGTLPQTGNDRNDGVVQSGVGIFGLVSAAAAALGLRKRN